MAKNLRFGFCGSGRFAAECLSIIAQKAIPEWVVTNAPRPSGRGLHLQNTPVFEKAEELGLKTRTTSKLSADAETIEWIMSDIPDLILVIDFGHMIKEPLLNMAPLGCINIHPSMLPAYRGSAPVQRAIMDGLKETGVTIFRLDEGMDSGPILSQIPVIISDEDDTASFLSKHAVLAVRNSLSFCFIFRLKTGSSFLRLKRELARLPKSINLRERSSGMRALLIY